MAYLCYTHVVSAIFSLCGVYDSIIASFTGDLIFFSYEETDGYLDISHVGIYVGNGKMVDARGTAYGVVYRDVPTSGMVMVGRPN